MRRTTLLLAAVSMCGALAQAQVINGESTYDDNYIHTPPAEPTRTAPRDLTTKASKPETKPADQPSGTDAPPY